jgi:ABC-type lipoprotein release transport system permease subunit
MAATGRPDPRGELVYLTYIRRELRRRLKQSLVIALGLAIGIGLVVTVSSAAAGVKDAQRQVLHSLYGVGTDMTVTKSASRDAIGPQRFRNFGPPPSSGTQKLARDVLHPQPGAATLPASDVAKVAALHGVAAASGGLLLADTKFSGTLVIQNSGGGGNFRSGGAGPSVKPSFSLDSLTVDGIAVSGSGVGPLTSSQVTTGRFFARRDAKALVAIVSKTYARQHSLHVGSTVKIAGKKLKVIGVATVSSGSADVFIPLQTAQKLAGLAGKVTTIFVSVSSASQVSSVASEVKAALPSATVSTSADLAKEVTGALSSASSLTANLGRWLSFAALAVAFLLAGLLMMAAVSRRVREFGTLKAIGWRTRRVVAQVVGEGVALGVLGGLAGVLLGVAAAAAISAAAPSLTATVGSSFATAGGFGPATTAGPAGRAGGPFGGAQSVLVHLTAPLQTHTVLLALVLALLGGLVAGAFGAWRAARLRPADALRSVG